VSDFTILEADSPSLAAAVGDLDEATDQIVSAAVVGDEQSRVRAEMLAFCARHPDALHRMCLDGHLTGSAVVVDPASARTLLIRHAKLGRWLQPGGHADGDGNLGAVALREAAEETGLHGLRLVTPAIDLDIHTIPARAGEPEHLHLDVRSLVLVGRSLAASPNEETLGAMWLAADDDEIAGNPELERLVRRGLVVGANLAG
jgi:8-oxo-dGTP pyrophosphatase MutT (NUDIX family)